MRNRIRVMLYTLVLTAFTFTVSAMDGLMVHNAHARATFAMASTGAVYMSLMNHSTHSATLTGVSVAETVASEAQIHTTIMDGDVMKMRQVTVGIYIEPHETVEFKPGGFHIMLMGLASPLKTGESFELELKFEDGTSTTINVDVIEQSKGGGHHHH